MLHLLRCLLGVWFAGILVLVLGQLCILAADALWRWRTRRRAVRALRLMVDESRQKFVALMLRRDLPGGPWRCGRPDCLDCNPPKEMRN